MNPDEPDSRCSMTPVDVGPQYAYRWKVTNNDTGKTVESFVSRDSAEAYIAGWRAYITGVHPPVTRKHSPLWLRMLYMLLAASIVVTVIFIATADVSS